MGHSCISVFTNTRSWEQQEWNKIKKQTNKVRREAWVWKEAKWAQKKKSWQSTISESKYNNNKYITVFCKIWKMYNEIQLKNKMNINKRKMRNHLPSTNPYQAIDNTVRNSRSNWLAITSLLSWAVPPKQFVHSINRCSLCWELTLQPSACERTN